MLIEFLCRERIVDNNVEIFTHCDVVVVCDGDVGGDDDGCCDY